MKLLTAVCLVALVLSFAISAQAENGLNLTLKQGMIYNWEDKKTDNLSTFEVVKTRKVNDWGKWNALWVGWTIDVGVVYDANDIDTVALLVGREVGVLGDYFPLDFPLKDLLTITIYPVGVTAKDIFNSPNWGIATGGGIIKFSIKTD